MDMSVIANMSVIAINIKRAYRQPAGADF